jgi:hypothetical protein
MTSSVRWDLPDGWFTKDGNSYCSEHWPMVWR